MKQENYIFCICLTSFFFLILSSYTSLYKIKIKIFEGTYETIEHHAKRCPLKFLTLERQLESL